MKATRLEVMIGAMAIAVCLAAVLSSRAQAPNPLNQAGAPAKAKAGPPASMDAQREQIWNSPDMLRARAWLQDYCSKSAKVTPEEAKTYMTELQNLTPTQMKLWLLKFDEQEEARQQKYAFWQQSHAAGVSRAVQANQNTQKAFSSITQGETEAATEAQQQINEQTQFQQNEAMNNQVQPIGPYGAGGYFPVYGGVHYHTHSF